MGNQRPSASKAALVYLRERAMLAHLDGNGVLANHLVAIAIEEVRKARETEASLPVLTWSWSVILGLYWLTDSYMLHDFTRELEKSVGETKEDEALLGILRAYEWLVRQPLDPNCEDEKAALKTTEFGWLKNNNLAEFEILLSHSLELLWFRNPRGTDWVEIGNNYVSQVAAPLSQRIQALIQRLKVQTSFTVLGEPSRNDLTIDADWEAPLWIPQLWQMVFDCEFAGVEKILAAESPRHAATTPTARLLFDVRHFNRLRGSYGDPQAVGLTRRRLITSLSPELAFHSVREDRARAVIVELIADSGKASDRFFGFTLAMLLEISALRRWDLGSWCTAMELQARLNAEVVANDRTEMVFVDRAIRCAVTAFRLEPKNIWIKPVLARLEFLPQEALTGLIHDLLKARPVQFKCTKRVLDQIGDAIAPVLYEDLAHWALRYIHHIEHVDRLSWSTDELEFLAPLFAVMPEDHGAWGLLWPTIERLFQTPYMWRTNHGRLLRKVLLNSPTNLAKRGVELMLSTDADDFDKRSRWQLLREVACERSALGVDMGRQILNSAPSSEDKVSVRDEAWAKVHVEIDDAAVRLKAISHLADILNRAVMSEGQKQFSFSASGWEGFYYVQWLNEDIAWAKKLIEAIGHPRVLTSFLHLLLAYLRAMVFDGPPAFAMLAAPSLKVWLGKPPIGIDPIADKTNSFSTLVYRPKNHSLIINELVLLAALLRPKIRPEIDNELIQYLVSIVAQPPEGVTNSAMRLTLDLVVDYPQRRAELLTICQALILTAQLRATADPAASEEYMDAFRHPTWFASPFRSPPVAEEVVRDLISKIEPLVASAAKAHSARVRGQIAAFIAALKYRDLLTPELQEVYNLLSHDPRAGVRKSLNE